MKKADRNITEHFRINITGSEIIISLKETVTLVNSSDFNINLIESHFTDEIRLLTIDFSGLKSYDSYLVIFLSNLKGICKSKGIPVNMKGVNTRLAKFLDAFSFSQKKILAEQEQSGFWLNYFSNIGELTLEAFHDIKLFIEFLGELIVKLMGLIIHPPKMRWKDFPFHMMNAGVNAVPIVVLIVFLVGIISGYQGAMQLRQFGADIYIADLIGISITRELGPLMTAILVAGRSGSAYAAEIGTMKVSDEIDALNSMGFDHLQFLVLPRIVAVMLAMPILVLLADLAGVVGGLIAAVSTLEITSVGYINQLQTALSYGDIFSGLIKSIIFGFLVATVGCFRGLQVRGGAESVGKYTTAAVVTGVLSIIVADAVFTFIFQALNI